MSPNGKLPVRLILYGVVAIYLAGDLFVFKGPLRHKLDLTDPDSPASIEAAKSRGVVARVGGYPITRSQVDRALAERLWLDGKSTEDLSPDEMKVAGAAALDELVEHELLRLEVKATAPQLRVTDEEINQRLARLLGRFESKGAMQTAMKSQGITNERNLRERLSARIQQEKFISLKLASTITVTDEEARSWFDKNAESVALPERIEARHVFIPTLDHPPEEAKRKLDEALAALNEKKKDFATLAKEVSEDPATRENGGSLGWMTRDRLPADFSTPVFPLALNKPTLVRTKLGWHLVEVTARKPAEPRSFDQAKPEIVAALEAIKRQQAVADFRKVLRATDTHKIEIFDNGSGIASNQAVN